MYKNLKLDWQQESEIVSFVSDLASEYKERLESRLSTYMEIYNAYNTFK